MPDPEQGGESRLINEKWFTQTPQGLALAASKCRSCGKVYFPRKRVCPQCFLIDQMEEVALSRRGRLYTFTIAEAGPPGFDVPYAFGYVDLPEGVRVFAPLTDCEFDKLEIGLELEMVLGDLRQENGVRVIGYKFRPLQGA